MGMESDISIPVRWSTAILATTVVTVLVIAGSGLYLWTLDWPQMMVWLKYLLTVVFVLTIVICAGYTPVRLKANSEKITVTRLFKPIEIPICGIKEMKRIGKSDISDSIRTFGSGGLFGYIGRFKNSRLGHYRMYATELKNLLFIRTDDNKRYVFSCVRSEEFVAYVNSKLS